MSPPTAPNGLTPTTPPPIPDPWSHPGPSAFDFRSDTTTRPTPRMLLATQHTTLDDDVFHEDATTNALEALVAGLCGMEAGLFVVSGTMGNQLSVRAWVGGVLWGVLVDGRAHLLEWEAGGISALSGALPQPVVPANGHHISLADVQKHAVLSSDHHYCPTRLICLENTLGGAILPLQDCQEIAAWARRQDPPIRLHLDGARLWEAVAAGAGSLAEYSKCFDSVTMCFSKGLGAPIGSIIVASKAFIARARHIRKMMGGGMRQAGVVTAAAKVSVEDTFLGGKLAETHAMAVEVGRMWERRGGKLQMPVETNMVWLDLGAAGCEVERLVVMGREMGIRFLGGRVVCHYQICAEAVERLGRVMDALLGTVVCERVLASDGAEVEAREDVKKEME